MKKQIKTDCNTCKHRYIVIDKEADSTYCACDTEKQTYSDENCKYYLEGDADRSVYLSME